MDEPVIRAAHATLGYEGNPVLHGLEFQVPPGSRVGILGPNGGGKTTLFRGLTGEIEPLSGRLEVSATTATVAQTDRSRLDYPVWASRPTRPSATFPAASVSESVSPAP